MIPFTPTFLQLTILFAVYSVIGWILEVIYRAIAQQTFFPPKFFRPPFSPLYGGGALLILYSYTIVQHLHILLQFLFYMLLIATYEYVCGWIVYRFLHIRAWDYSQKIGNVHGHTDAWHAFLWGICALGCIYILNPWIWNYFCSYTVVVG